MANDLPTNLNDNLLKEKIFNCRICDELCISDIYLIIGKGNVCLKCYEKCEDKSRAELNSAHIFIMSQLILPCKYESKGCIKKLTCKNYEKHTNACEYKVKPCHIVRYADCKWNGNIFEISEHISTYHKEHVMKSDNNIFEVDTSLSEPYNIKLLIGDHKSCLLTTSIINNMFYYAMNPIYLCEENIEYSVRHKSKETPNFLKTVGTLTKLNSVYDEFNLNKNPYATEVINMELLQHLADKNNIIVNEFNLNPSDIDEKTLKLLECPVCFHIMRPPIYLCLNGHSICIFCHEKLQECPTCSEDWATNRNFLIEGLTNSLKYPCRFKELGCKEFGTEPQVSKHEESCPLHIFRCPMRCGESGIYEFIVEHLNSAHKEMELTSNLTFTSQSPSTKKWTLFDSKIFRISYYPKNHGIKWVAQLCCSNENPSSYIYTVEVLKSAGEWSLIKNDACVRRGSFGNDHCTLACDSVKFNVSIKRANQQQLSEGEQTKKIRLNVNV